MHRLAKAILHRDTEDANLKDLVVWVLLSWRYSLQLTWWLAVRIQLLSKYSSRNSLCCMQHKAVQRPCLVSQWYTGWMLTLCPCNLVQECAKVDSGAANDAAGALSLLTAVEAMEARAADAVGHAAAAAAAAGRDVPDNAAPGPFARMPEAQQAAAGMEEVEQWRALAAVLRKMEKCGLGLHAHTACKQYEKFCKGLEIFGVCTP